MSIIRTRWAAIGAAVAVTLGAGGIGIVSATQPDDAVTFVPITPCRVMDTRTEFNVGPKSSPLGPGEVYTVNTTTADTGNCTDIPTTATGVSLNITALDATLPTFLTVWATGEPQPEASSLNPVPGQPPTPNAVTTGINTNGQFDIYNLQGNVQVIADINGYYTDHHHDDRYYTEAEVDAALDKAKYVNLQTLRNVSGWEASFPNGGPLGFETSLVVPPDYTAGTDMLLRLHILKLDYGTVGGCTVDLEPNAMYMFRPSTDITLNDDGGSVSDGLGDPAPISFDAVFRQIRTIDIVVSQPGTIPIEPGDSATLGFFLGSSTCNASELGVHSAALYYD